MQKNPTTSHAALTSPLQQTSAQAPHRGAYLVDHLRQAMRGQLRVELLQTEAGRDVLRQQLVHRRRARGNAEHERYGQDGPVLAGKTGEGRVVDRLGCCYTGKRSTSGFYSNREWTELQFEQTQIGSCITDGLLLKQTWRRHFKRLLIKYNIMFDNNIFDELRDDVK